MSLSVWILVLLLLTTSAVCTATVPGTRMEIDWPDLVSQHDIKLSSPPADSYQGLLLGNGDIAVSVFGKPDLLRLHVGKNDLWDYRCPMDEKRPVSHKEFLDKYANPQKPPVANYLFDANVDPWNVDIRLTYLKGMPTIKPAGQIRFRNKTSGGTAYSAKLSMWNAEATVESGQAMPALQAFVSYSRNLIVARYDPAGAPDFDIELARHKDCTGLIPNAPEFGAEGPDIWVRYRFPADAANYPHGFEYVMYGRIIGGDSVKTETVSDFAQIEQAIWRVGQVATDPVKTTEGISVAHIKSHSPVTVITAVFTTRDDPQPFSRAKREVESAAKAGLSKLTMEHRTWWHEYWQKSFVQLSDKPFLNRVWFFSQYLLACSWRKGKIAPGLFGSWTWEDYPLFGNDYHWDYNMQQAVWGAYSSNHLEQTAAYNETALALLPTAITDAKETYGIDGAKFFLASYPRKYGHNPFPLLHYDKMMSLNGWVAHPLWWHYLYSQDDNYLREQAYPLLRECAKFYESYLTRASDGRYDIWPTVAWDVDFTPHLKDNKNFPMDLSFIKYLMKACIDASETLDVDADRRGKWQEIAEDLREYPTIDTPEGKVFSAYPGANSGYHFPLASMMIFPGDDIGLHSPKDMRDTALRTIAPMTYQGDEQLLKAMMRARMGLDDMDAFEKQLEATTRPNGTMSYGGQWFFWVHGAGNSIWINENLLQSYNGRIRLAPVKLKTGTRFFNLRTVGAFLVSGEIRPGGEVAYASVTSEAGKMCKLIKPWSECLRIRDARSMKPVTYREVDETVYFGTEKGATYIIDRPSQPWEKQPVVRIPEH